MSEIMRFTRPEDGRSDGLALEALGVSKRYGDRDALCGVDLVARPGRLHGLLGPNGAGKTTLMRILLGLVRRDAGSVRLVGRDVDAASEPLPDRVAALIDTPAFYPYLSGRANLSLLARLDGETRGRDSGIDRALEQTGIGTPADDAVGSY